MWSNPTFYFFSVKVSNKNKTTSLTYPDRQCVLLKNVDSVIEAAYYIANEKS